MSLITQLLVRYVHILPIRYIAPPKFPHKNLPIPTTGSGPHPTHRSLEQPDPPPQTASQSSLPFFQTSRLLQTDGQTDRTMTEVDRGSNRPLSAMRPKNNTGTMSYSASEYDFRVVHTMRVCIHAYPHGHARRRACPL